MKIGWAYMGISALLVIVGTFMAIDGIDPYGDLLLASSLLFIYLGSNALADDRKAREAAEADTE
ncbi:hypothetical protein [Halohasta salina]|uniref:hypothetical protein n=1 Tax=Halohasta salina TaxID=2961621 RepID=UPI0020A3E7F5|nr:hypothetical protein [Halohasta salina]